MFSFLGKLFGTDKAGEKLVDGATSAIDKIWYTEEEKAEDAAQAKREAAAVYMKWLESTSGSRLARRMIAFMVTAPWALANFVAMVLRASAPFFPESAEVINASASSLTSDASENNTLVGVVLLFYFGGPAAVDASKGLVQKWVNKGK